MLLPGRGKSTRQTSWKSLPNSYLIPNLLADSGRTRYTAARPPPSSTRMLRLGPALLHPENQSLTIGARTVALQRKPYLVLQYLIENRDRMIQRKELLDQFWDGQEVYDESLSKAIGTIRKAFGDVPGSPQFIETRWGQGYRYIGPFDESPAPAANPSNHPNLGGEGHGATGGVSGQTTASAPPTPCV